MIESDGWEYVTTKSNVVVVRKFMPPPPKVCCCTEQRVCRGRAAQCSLNLDGTRTSLRPVVEIFLQSGNEWASPWFAKQSAGSSHGKMGTAVPSMVQVLEGPPPTFNPRLPCSCAEVHRLGWRHHISQIGNTLRDMRWRDLWIRVVGARPLSTGFWSHSPSSPFRLPAFPVACVS